MIYIFEQDSRKVLFLKKDLFQYHFFKKNLFAASGLMFKKKVRKN